MNSKINQQQLIRFLTENKSFAGHIMSKDWAIVQLKPIGFKIDIAKNLLILEEKQIRIREDYGFNDKSGYAIGFLIEAIWSLLLNTEPQEMACSFPSSMWFLFEVHERTERYIAMITNSFLSSVKEENV
jgi:hypothetical protein